MPEITYKRCGELVRGVFKILLEEPDGLSVRDIFVRLEKEVPPTSFEKTYYPNGVRRYEKIVRWMTVNYVKSGWLVKDYGRWFLTPIGKDIYNSVTDPKEFHIRSREGYKQWEEGLPLKADDVGEVSESDGEEMPSVTLEMAEEDAWAEVHAHLSELAPDAFEEAVAGLLQGMGHHIESTASGGADGGVDIYAAADGVAGRRIKVQVKRRQDTISVHEIRSFRDTLKEGDTGMYVSIGDFTKDATKEARVGQRHLILINGKRFFDLWVSHYEKIPERRRRLLPIKRVAFLNPQ